MKLSRSNLLSLAFVVLAFVMAIALYDRLPQATPIHWNAQGEPNGYMPKPWGPFLLPLSMVFTYLVLTVVSRVMPRGYRVESFQRPFEIVSTAVMAFLLFMTVLALLAGAGIGNTMARAPYAGIGLFLVVLGNFLGKTTKNFMIGIRTPWTIASDEVWLRTHRLAGKLSVLAGAVVLASAFFGGGEPVLLGAIIVAFGVPTVYSYFVYRRVEGTTPGGHGSHGAT